MNFFFHFPILFFFELSLFFDKIRGDSALNIKQNKKASPRQYILAASNIKSFTTGALFRCPKTNFEPLTRRKSLSSEVIHSVAHFQLYGHREPPSTKWVLNGQLSESKPKALNHPAISAKHVNCTNIFTKRDKMRLRRVLLREN